MYIRDGFNFKSGPHKFIAERDTNFRRLLLHYFIIIAGRELHVNSEYVYTTTVTQRNVGTARRALCHIPRDKRVRRHLISDIDFKTHTSLRKFSSITTFLFASASISYCSSIFRKKRPNGTVGRRSGAVAI